MNLSSSQQSLFSLLWERKRSLQRMGTRERFMEILLLSQCNISSLFAFHSGHCQGWVRFYTQAFRCGVFLKKKTVCKCVYFVGLVCRGVGGGCNSLLWSLSAFFCATLPSCFIESASLSHAWFDRENSCLPSKYLMLWLLDYSEIYASVFLISESRLWAFFLLLVFGPFYIQRCSMTWPPGLMCAVKWNCCSLIELK